MKIEMLKIDSVKPYDNNPRMNDEAVQYVANSIKEFGFKVPIVIDKNNVIVTGHTRWKASKQLGLKEVPCIRADDLSDEQIKAFRIADNKTSEQANWDFDKLKFELEDIDFDMTDFGFGDFELTMITNGGDFEPEPYDDSEIEEYDEIAEDHLAKKRIIIVYDDETEGLVKQMTGLEEITKVVFDIKELNK